MTNPPLVLAILDGWGLGSECRGNAIAGAYKPNMEKILTIYPYTCLDCSGEAVGLPEGQMGNSEVGHLNIGAGRVVYQELTRITRAIKDGSFFKNRVLLDAVRHVRANGSALHLMGLVSDGGVHSHINHLYALLEMAGFKGLSKVFVHCFLDGRDVPPKSALTYVEQLEKKMRETATGKIATVSGRYYAMDRDRRWERTGLAYLALRAGEGVPAFSAEEAVKESYARDEADEFVRPTVIAGDYGRPVAVVEDGDAVVFFNFRPDRARQITRSLVDPDFTGFSRAPPPPGNLYFACMTQYDLTIDAPVAFPQHDLKNTLGEVLSSAGIRQLRLAETEKYAHVTFFFNGGVEKPFPGEERILIPSPMIATYDLKPEMSAFEVTQELLSQIDFDRYGVIAVNYANADMVGHTGILEAAVRSVEAVDRCLGRVVEAVLSRGGVLLVTADHGNAECMLDESCQPVTAHTTNRVPFILVGERYRQARLKPGRLEDIAPTILDILGIEKPGEMTGRTLIDAAM